MEAYNEIAFEWCRGEKTAKISAYAGSWVKNRILKYAEKYPDDVKIVADNKDGSVFAEVPVSWIKIQKPREMSEEQREQARERLLKWRKENPQKSESEN